MFPAVRERLRPSLLVTGIEVLPWLVLLGKYPVLCCELFQFSSVSGQGMYFPFLCRSVPACGVSCTPSRSFSQQWLLPHTQPRRGRVPPGLLTRMRVWGNGCALCSTPASGAIDEEACLGAGERCRTLLYAQPQERSEGLQAAG